VARAFVASHTSALLEGLEVRAADRAVVEFVVLCGLSEGLGSGVSFADGDPFPHGASLAFMRMVQCFRESPALTRGLMDLKTLSRQGDSSGGTVALHCKDRHRTVLTPPALADTPLGPQQCYSLCLDPDRPHRALFPCCLASARRSVRLQESPSDMIIINIVKAPALFIIHSALLN
jgi:hypothetical protein